MQLFSQDKLEKKLDSLKAYLHPFLPKNYTIPKLQIVSTLAQVANSPYTSYEIDMAIRAILIIAALISIYVSYKKHLVLRNKEEADADIRTLIILEAARIADQKVAKETVEYNETISPRLDEMETRVIKMTDQLSYLRKLCPQMNDRRITFATTDSNWPITYLSHGDIIVIDYTLIDIIDNTPLGSSQAKYIQTGISGLVSAPTEILLPAGVRILVTRASRIPRGIRDMENSIDLTISAKAALETCLTRSYS